MVRSYLGLLEERYGEDLDEEALEMLRFASEGADRMNEMLDGLVTYARVERQDQAMDPVELDEVIDDAMANLSLLVDEHEATIERQSLPTVAGDDDQLVLCFQNLLENAIQYGGSTPTVRIESHRDGDEVEIRVVDDGPGIPEDEQDECLRLFQRGNRDANVDGSGIGLGLCDRIVDHHGGSLLLDSNPGEGTTVRVRLPLAEPEGDPDG